MQIRAFPDFLYKGSHVKHIIMKDHHFLKGKKTEIRRIYQSLDIYIIHFDYERLDKYSNMTQTISFPCQQELLSDSRYHVLRVDC